MKNFFKLIALALVLVVGQQSMAQKQYKFGHIDSKQLLEAMPERVAAEKEMEGFAKQLEDNALALQTEFERKYNDYVAQMDSLTPIIRQDKETELAGMQQRIQTFSQQAQQEMMNKENQLLQPIIEKARKAIKDVADENGYTYVFDVSTGAIVHFADDSDDLLPLVKAKLGIQ
jgi:outer membrane protein